MLNAISSPKDAERLAAILAYLGARDFSSCALTGGIAIECCLHERGLPNVVRPLHDIDWVVEDFSHIPKSIGDECLIRHLHPHDPPGKNLLQALHVPSVMRVDIFRAYGNELTRLRTITLNTISFRVVAFEDLLARHARLCSPLLRSKTVPPKYVRDFLRMLQAQRPNRIEDIWPEHRKPSDPSTFNEAAELIREAAISKAELLVPDVYSTDVTESCPRCAESEGFKRADPQRILDLLGYC
jgi:hypothetical protein